MNAPPHGTRHVRGDVVIFGGGVTGCAASIAVSARGLTPILLDRDRGPTGGAGESLSGAAVPLLRRFGIWSEFCAQGHLESSCTRSVWGSQDLHARALLFEPFGSSWQIDRAAFEALLVRHAVGSGGLRLTTSDVPRVRRDASGWSVEALAQGPVSIQARFAIDATGGVSWLARQEGVERAIEDRLEALIGQFEESHPTAPVTVESCPDGWWYSAPMPDGTRVVALFAEPGTGDRRAWSRGLDRTTAIRAHTASARPRSWIRREVEVSRSRHFAGDRWLAAGDAAFTHDPLSAHGLTAGLWGGALSGEAAAAWLAGDTGPSKTYTATLERIWERDRRIRTAFYRTEERWTEQPFWRSRVGKLPV